MRKPGLLTLLYCLFSTGTFSQESNSYPLKAEAKIVHSAYYPFVGMELNCSSPVYQLASNKLSDVALKITNTSNRNVYFWAMTCSWESNLILEDSFATTLSRVCDSNFPVLYELKPGENKVYKTIVCINPKRGYTYVRVMNGDKLSTTKLGFIIVVDFYKKDYVTIWSRKGPGLAEIAKEKKNQVAIIWSNQIDFL